MAKAILVPVMGVAESDGLRERWERAWKDYHGYVKVHSVWNVKARRVTCRNCGSMLACSSMRSRYPNPGGRDEGGGRCPESQRCPVCGADMRPASVRRRETELQSRCREAEELLRECLLRRIHDASVRGDVEAEHEAVREAVSCLGGDEGDWLPAAFEIRFV